MTPSTPIRTASRLIFLLSACLCLGAAVYFVLHQSWYELLLALAGVLVLPIPILADHVLHLRRADTLHLATNLFIFASYTLGSVVRGYSWIPYYDKVMHTVSGVFFFLVGILLYYQMKPVHSIEPHDGLPARSFALCFSIAIAAAWEIFEYVGNLIFHTDPQQVLTTGINDTMLDVIVCTIGAIASFLIVKNYCAHNRAFLSRLVHEFFDRSAGNKKPRA